MLNVKTIGLALALGLAGSALGAQSLDLDLRGGLSKTVDKFGTCRVISNAPGNPELAVPTRSAAEWSSGANAFLNNLSSMPGVSVASCAPPLQVLHASQYRYYSVVGVPFPGSPCPGMSWQPTASGAPNPSSTPLCEYIGSNSTTRSRAQSGFVFTQGGSHQSTLNNGEWVVPNGHNVCKINSSPPAAPSCTYTHYYDIRR